MASLVSMSALMFQDIHQHLFRPGDRREHGGFLMCQFDPSTLTFKSLEWLPLNDNDYLIHERDYLELTDETRGRIIKHAHDLECSLVEIHSHPGPYKAEFSIADYVGFQAFVPHVHWRLNKRPYGALVFAFESIDGFAWIDQAPIPTALKGIQTEHQLYSSTGLSMDTLERGHYEREI